MATLSSAWAYGKNHQVAVVALGLLTCLLAMLVAGRIRYVRRVGGISFCSYSVVVYIWGGGGGVVCFETRASLIVIVC